MRRVLGPLGRPYVLVTAAIVATVLAYVGLANVEGARKRAHLDPQWETGKVNLLVRLNFEPEKFHILALQAAGRFAGYDAKTGAVTIYDVPPEQLVRISKEFWVSDLTILEAPA